MSADEFDTIRELFAPLAGSAPARALADDAAVIEAGVWGSGPLVVTTDAIVEGVHFLADDPIGTIAKKALRVNISDLTAKGAKGLGALLTLIWPKHRPAAQIRDFAKALGEDLQLFEMALIGGDTTSTPGPLTVSIAAFGAPAAPMRRTPSRADARVGDHVWVTGFIGDAYLGLRALRDAPDLIGAKAGDRSGLVDVIDCYRVPRPPVRFAEAIGRYASASTDVSDGLAADAANIARASNAGLHLHAEAIPLSASGHAYISKHGPAGLAELATGGDDYQVLFTAAPGERGAILEAAREAGVNAALIGDVVAGEGVKISQSDGARLELALLGHRHRLGR